MGNDRLRQAVRAVVIDPDDRVFLVLFGLTGVDVWALPGGGIEEAESPELALARELHEEVGSIAFDIGPKIWTRTHLWGMGADYDGQRETIFLVRVDTAELGSPSLSDEQLRQELVIDRRWWTIDELRTADAEFAPTLLPDLVADLVNNGPPDAPIDVGI